MIVTRKATTEDGALVRGWRRRLLAYVKHHYDDVEITWHEDKGWLDSMFYITLRGEESRVNAVIACIKYNEQRMKAE